MLVIIATVVVDAIGKSSLIKESLLSKKNH
jgi:hypothetical protein